MKVMIHAVPSRMWYVEGFLVPSLRAQGIEPQLYVDTRQLGNLGACLDSFRQCYGDGTWHIQDDVLLCRDFAKRAAENDEGVVNGFCCLGNGDDPEQCGRISPRQLWHGFPCIRIPDEYARDFAVWVETGKHTFLADKRIRQGKGDDYLFHEYFRNHHRKDKARNIAPNLVEHVDWLLGGSVANAQRVTQLRSVLWPDQELVEQLAAEIQNHTGD